MGWEIIMRQVQSESFPVEIKALSENKPLTGKSKILNLNLLLDQNGILRVGGRL